MENYCKKSELPAFIIRIAITIVCKYLVCPSTSHLTTFHGKWQPFNLWILFNGPSKDKNVLYCRETKQNEFVVEFPAWLRITTDLSSFLWSLQNHMRKINDSQFHVLPNVMGISLHQCNYIYMNLNCILRKIILLLTSIHIKNALLSDIDKIIDCR